MADTTLTQEAAERVKSEALTREDAYGQLWVLAEDYYDALIDMDRIAADKERAFTERDAARAEVARLTAALADAERRGAERMLPLINAAAGATTAIAHALDDGDVADNSAGNLEASLSALNSALEPPIRALPLPPRERDGQEGEA